MQYISDTNLLVRVKDVYKSFSDGTVKAVDGVNLSIGKGQFVAILGPNGAGKTTLVEMIEGIQMPDKGDIFLFGKHWKNNEDEIHSRIGISLQETRFIDKLNVLETLTLFASFYQLNHKRVEEVIHLIGLDEKKKSFTVNLSGGQRQKLAIGIALLNNPELLLLDEPTTGLDPNARREIWNILLDLKGKFNVSLILTTHYMGEAEQLCDYIIIMDKGTILKEGTLEQLLNENLNEKYIDFYLNGSSINKNPFLGSPFNIIWNDSSERGILILKNIEKELPDFLKYLKEQNLQLKNFESRRKTLDDLFTSLTGRHLDE